MIKSYLKQKCMTWYSNKSLLMTYAIYVYLSVSLCISICIIHAHLISTSVWWYLVPSPWAHVRFVAWNKHVHPLSLTSSFLLYITLHYILNVKILVSVPIPKFFQTQSTTRFSFKGLNWLPTSEHPLWKSFKIAMFRAL